MLSSETRMPVVKPAKVTIHRSDYRTSVQRANVLSMAVSIKSRNDSRHGALAGTSGGDNRGRRQGGVERTSESMEIATLHVKVLVRISLPRRPEHAASALGSALTSSGSNCGIQSVLGVRRNPGGYGARFWDVRRRMRSTSSLYITVA